MKRFNMAEVKEPGTRLPAGGYVCGITDVEDDAAREFLKLNYDIAEGEYKNYYRQLYGERGFWGGVFCKSYKENARPFFKQFVTAVEDSNPGYRFNFDEQTLKRKLVGLVLSEEEYLNTNGEVKTRLYASVIMNAEKIRAGEYTVEAPKKLANDARRPMKESPKAASEYEDDLPF